MNAGEIATRNGRFGFVDMAQLLMVVCGRTHSDLASDAKPQGAILGCWRDNELIR